MNLPVDVAKYVRKKIIRCIALFAILECVTILISILTWDYFASRTPLSFHIGVIFWINVIPFWISKFPISLIDKSWSGEVVEVSIEEERSTYNISMGKCFPYVKHVIYLDVKLDNKKHKRIAIQEFGVRNDNKHNRVSCVIPNEGDVTKHLDDYSVGDRVYHFYGLKHYYVVKKNLNLSECVVCGVKNKKESDTCVNCGYSIIKNIGINT